MQLQPVPVATIMVVASLLSTSNVDAQLKSVGKKWPVDQRVAIEAISHTAFDALLQKYVGPDGMVDYKAWKNSPTDRKGLQSYLAELSRADHGKAATPAAKLAYWINAYNAVTLEGIIEVYPTTSIRKHTKTFGYNIWKDLKLISGEKTINLNDIEHKILRKMNEPRIHFAIVCASIGCPRLLNQAYVADKLEQQLTANAKDFFSRPQNLVFDHSSKKLQLSAILKWFATDFGADQQAQIRNIAAWFPEETRRQIAQRGFSVGYLDYDWNLNAKR